MTFSTRPMVNNDTEAPALTLSSQPDLRIYDSLLAGVA